MNRKGQLVLISVLFFTLMPILSFAGEVDLLRTGQETCYDERGVVIDCADTGQDGDIQAGVEWPDPRFEDNGDGTMTDHLTGLIWLKNAGCRGQKNWNDALTYCNNLSSGSCELTDGSAAGDWRLPNIVELETLVNAEKPNPAVWLTATAQGFVNVQASYYWSATTSAFGTNYAWFISMYRGSVRSSYKSGSHWVWPVRSEQGTSITPDGGEDEGGWNDGKKNGFGVYVHPDGSKYKGEWKDGLMNGQGTFIYPDGTKYDGQWKDGKAHGKGTMIWPDDVQYDGQWKDNERNGQGVMTYPDGTRKVGEFKAGKLIDPTTDSSSFFQKIWR